MKYMKYIFTAFLLLIVCDVFHSALTSDIADGETVRKYILDLLVLLPLLSAVAACRFISKLSRIHPLVSSLLSAAGLFLIWVCLIFLAFCLGNIVNITILQ